MGCGDEKQEPQDLTFTEEHVNSCDEEREIKGVLVDFDKLLEIPNLSFSLERVDFTIRLGYLKGHLKRVQTEHLKLNLLEGDAGVVTVNDECNKLPEAESALLIEDSFPISFSSHLNRGKGRVEFKRHWKAAFLDYRIYRETPWKEDFLKMTKKMGYKIKLAYLEQATHSEKPVGLLTLILTRPSVKVRLEYRID